MSPSPRAETAYNREMGHDHDHGEPVGISNVRVGAAAGINVGFAVVQVLVGVALGSVAVLADALHQVVDAVGLLTALTALVLLRRPATSSMTFGWGKADALGGYTSGLLLLGSIVWVLYESVKRLIDPVSVSGGGVILIGLAGIAVNGFSVYLLGSGDFLSLRAARLHLLVDLAGSVIVVVAGVVLQSTTYTWVDPVASLLISGLVLRGTWGLLRHSGAQLLDRSPLGADSNHIGDLILAQAGVNDVHHVHTRSIAPGVASVTAHVVMDGTVSLHEAQESMSMLREELADRLGIAHATIQLECHNCADANH